MRIGKLPHFQAMVLLAYIFLPALRGAQREKKDIFYVNVNSDSHTTNVNIIQKTSEK